MPERHSRSENRTAPAAAPLSGPMPASHSMAAAMSAPKVRPKHTGETVRRITGYLSRQRTGLLSVLLLTILSTGTALLAPYLLGYSFDHYLLTADYPGLMRIALLLLAVYVISSLASWLQAYVMSGVTGNTVRDMRRDMFARLQELPLRFFDGKTRGELMSRTTNDMEQVTNTLNQSVTQLLSSVMTVAGALVFMISLNVPLTFVTLLTIPAVMFVTRKIAGFTRRHFREQQQSVGQLNGFIEETISGTKVMKVFDRDKTTLEQFRGINDQVKSTGIRSQIFAGMMGPVMNAINHTNFALMAAIGGWMAYNGWTSIGVIVSFLTYSRLFSRPINEMATQFNLIQSAVAGAERVFEIMDTPSEFTEEDQQKPLKHVQGKVVFDRVTFGYQQDVPVLKKVSLTAEPGETIALVGPTGAGKTTFVNLLTRFYDIQEGTISIDGTDIRELDKNSLRSQMAVVLQDAYLFHDTVRENIRYGRLDATDEEIEAAARLAKADGFIRKLPDGYDTLLAAEGSNLSHGQRQLITIARAILADPAILILDEATSSVDTRTELHIQEAMNELMKGRTSFVIAHRLSTIRNADQILVVNGGEIIERGNHEALLRHNGFYSGLFNSQWKRSG